MVTGNTSHYSLALNHQLPSKPTSTTTNSLSNIIPCLTSNRLWYSEVELDGILEWRTIPIFAKYQQLLDMSKKCKECIECNKLVNLLSINSNFLKDKTAKSSHSTHYFQTFFVPPFFQRDTNHSTYV